MASDVFHKLYYHIIWTTYQRLPVPDAAMREWLYRQILLQTEKRGGVPLACHVMPDHVHLLITIPPGNLPQTIGQIKEATSRMFNEEFMNRHTLKWQDGYGVLSLRESDTPAVIRYIENQEQIHASRRANSLMEITGEDTPQKNSQSLNPSDGIPF